ncbi:hypothetical protein ACT8ZR_09265 [Neobacillus sp. M.A.Huq-85]
MYKFRALIQFSYENVMYNPRRETYKLDNEIVRDWEKHGYVKIVEEKPKKAKKE